MSTPSDRARVLWGFAIVFAIGLAAQFAHWFDPADRLALDAQFRFLRERAPQPLAQDVALVGIDEGSLGALRDPPALWHAHFARFLKGVAGARPAAIGVAVTLPDRSYDFIVPGIDRTLAEAIAAARARAPLVLGQVPDEHGNVRPVFEPFAAAAGAGSLGSAALCRDPDRAVRSLEASACGAREAGSTLAARIAALLGAAGEQRGLINYALGERLGYLPFHVVLDWIEQRDEARLAAAFGGKPVLLGTVLPGAEREELPAAIAAFEPDNRMLPGLLVHAQALRSMLAQGLVRPVPGWIGFVVTSAALFAWFGASRWKKGLLLVLLLALLGAVSLNLLWKGWALPAASIALAAAFAAAARLAYDSALQKHARKLLQSAFQSSVSPKILTDILAGRIQPGLSGSRERICVLACDIRGFAARAGNLGPGETIELLDAYFTEMAHAVHKHEGTIDRFVADGMVAFFGAPKPLDCPEKNALEAAQDMLVALSRVNRRIAARGWAPIEIGIGIHSGEVVLGYVGGDVHREYLAVGDAPAIAAALEPLAAEAGFPVILSEPVARAVGMVGGVRAIGKREIGPHGALDLYGWRPPVIENGGEPAPATVRR